MEAHGSDIAGSLCINEAPVTMIALAKQTVRIV
jgi:hypothetical protein